jgi:uncharacterized protein involved in exopolysaccharide biosynthesis
MNSPFKVDFETRQGNRLNPRARRWDYRAHYSDLASRTLSSIVKHRIFILMCVVIGFALASIIVPLMPRKYSAEALIYPNMFSSDDKTVARGASVDGATMVAGEARAIRSDVIMRAVAMRLARDPGTATSRSWLETRLDWFRSAWLPETLNSSSFDRVVATLHNRIVVMNDARSYVVSVSFTASSAENAAQVVNAVVTEYLRDKVRQRRLSKIIAVEAELREQRAVYGEKHPKTLQALAELDSARAALEAATNPRDGDQDEFGNDQVVKLALPNHTPTSPQGLVVFGLSLLLALLAGIGVAVRRDRKEAQQTFDHQTHSQ